MTDTTAFRGKPGHYCMQNAGGGCYGPARFVCLNCTAYFRTKCSRTQLERGTHVGSMRVRFCPCCGAELTVLVTPKNMDENQSRLEL